MKLLITLLFTGFFFCANSQTAESYKEKALEYTQSENYKEALKAVNQALKIEPGDMDCYLLQASIFIELEKIEDAFITYKKALEINPKCADIYNERGILWDHLGLYDEALHDYDIAVDNADSDTALYRYKMNRAISYANVRNFKDAYSDMVAVYEFDSTNVGNLNNLAAVCGELGKPEQALQYLETVLRVEPTLYGAYTNIGFTYQNMGQYEKAIEYFSKHLSFETDPYAYNNRAYCKLQLNDLKGAMEDVQKSLKIAPGNEYAYRNRALIYLAKGSEQSACEDLQKAIDLGFTDRYGTEVLELQRKHCR